MIGLLHSTIRKDEKLLIAAAKKNDVKLATLDVRKCVLDPETWDRQFDVLLERCVSTTIGMHAAMFFESLGFSVVNSVHVARNCENKFLTSLILKQKNIPTIPFALVFTEQEACEAIGGLGGYPVVLKPVSGSWGRLLAKVNDRDALEAVIEQKLILGSPSHKALYMQKFVNKGGRDIRVMAVGERALCAIYRETSHWITNTARGAQAKTCKISRDLKKISLDVSKAIGGGVLGIDIFETNDGFLVNEVNHTPEFKNIQRVTGVDVAGAVIRYCKEAGSL